MKITVKKHRLLVGQSKNKEIEGFGGRPPVGGRPGARGPQVPPPKSGSGAEVQLRNCSLTHSLTRFTTECFVWFVCPSGPKTSVGLGNCSVFLKYILLSLVCK